jgi:integrase
MPQGGRLRYVPLTRRLADALNGARHLRSKRALCDRDGKSVTQKVVQVAVRRTGRWANVRPGVHILRHTFCSHLAMRGAAGESDSGARRTPGPLDHAALHSPEPGRARRGDQALGGRNGRDVRGRGEIVEAAGTEGPKAHFH